MMDFPGINSVPSMVRSAQQLRGVAGVRLDASTRLAGVDAQAQQLTARHEAQVARMLERVGDQMAGTLLDLVG